jgi:D-alanyl-D-alanine-carboxypeptidase/D-alanyl-D-alanine-endopeptidase
MPMIGRLLLAVMLASLIGTAGAQARQDSGSLGIPSDVEIREMLAVRINALAGQEDGIGIVVGIISPQGRRVISYGHLNQGDPRPLDGNTGFEIASVSKIFTALLLADMVQKHEVVLADPVVKYLPAGVKLPERNGHAITLLDLATHTSALPFMPDEMPTFGDSTAAQPSSADIYRFLGRYQLPRDPGADWDYSNLGYWLLGEALASRAGVDFENLLRARVLAPLNLKETAITPSTTLKANLAIGHDVSLQPAPYFSATSTYALMPAAGGLVSTTNDLLRLLSAVMGYQPSPLAPAMAAMLSTQRPKSPHQRQALGWVVQGDGNDELIFHDGGSFGFASSLAWDPKTRIGVVVLCNQLADVSDIARHLLRPNIPLAKPTAIKRTQISLDPAVLETYAGRYEASGEGIFRVALEATFLTIQAPSDWGLPKLRIHPESRRDFFATELPLRVTFQTDSGGHVTGMLVYPPRGQHEVPAQRMASDK